MEGKSLVISSVVLGACFAGGMYLAVPALEKAAAAVIDSNRVVTVKGLSERSVMSDHVYIPIRYSVRADNQADCLKQVESFRVKVMEHLKNQGIAAKDITDAIPNMYTYQENVQGQTRDVYNATAGVNVSTDDMAAGAKLLNSFYDLLNAGVPISDNSWSIKYTFGKLNSIKPEMIEEATKNARQVAEKFAGDSGSSLGKIKNANQGVFTILGSDNEAEKVVRVVTTVQFNLID